MALRGHASIQGSTDIPTLFNLLPGYLPMPHHQPARDVPALGRRDPAPGAEGLLGQRRGVRGQPAQGVLGRRGHGRQRLGLRLPAPADRRPRHLPAGARHDRRQDQGLLPARPEPGGRLGARQGAAPRHGQPRLAGRPRPLHDRERHLLEGRPRDRDRRDRARASAAPRCSSCRRPRTWRRKARSPRPSGCCSGARRPSTRRATAAPSCGSSTTWAGIVRERLAGSTLPRDRAMLDLTWDYPLHGERGDEPERRGRAQGDQRVRRRHRRAAARTSPSSRPTAPPSCGCWIYTGVFADGVNQAARRKPGSRAGLGGAASGAGPGRRTGASSTTAPPPTRDGKPWSERKKYVWWDAGGRRVDRLRRARLREDQAAVLPAAARARPASTAIAGDDAFIMQGDGKGWLYAPSGLIDGPMPTHYEPAESPVRNPLYAPAGQPDPQGLRPVRTT